MNENDFNDNFSDNFNDSFSDSHSAIEDFVSEQEARESRESGEGELLDAEEPMESSYEAEAISYRTPEGDSSESKPTKQIQVEYVEEDTFSDNGSRPLGSVEASQPPHSDTRSKSCSSKSCSGSKPKTSKLAIALLSGLFGLLAGGIGVYAGTVLLGSPKTDCPQGNCPSDPGPSDKPVTPPITSRSDRTFDFLKLEAKSENLIYSPLSINSALQLLSAGAAGTTKTEIDNVLGDAEVPKYENIADKLSLANAVFIKDTFESEVLDSYISAVTDNNNADIVFTDFADSSILDSWASDKTFGLINNLGIIPNADTRMVLANALAIVMDWQHPFGGDGTFDDTFYTASEEEISVPTMHDEFHNENITYAINSQETILTLPLDSASEDVELEFVAIMPNSSLSEYAQNVSIEGINTKLQKTTSASTPEGGLLVSIPKFNFDYELDFQKDLENLGMKSAFTKSADFSRMASEPLHVGNAVHKANIEFSESGIKAAAVTAFDMEANAMIGEKPEPVRVTIDRPFLFLIRDAANDAVWFVGTVYNPAAEE